MENAQLNKTSLEKNFEAHKKQYEETHQKVLKMEIELSVEKVKTNSLQLQLEDQINRSSRKTLIFKGIKEEKEESWQDTKILLSDVLAGVFNEDPEETITWIERAHRSRPNTHKQGKRDIFACFHNWNDSNYILKKFYRESKSGDSSYQHVVVD